MWEFGIAGIVRSGFFRSSLRSALRPLEYTPLRAPGYIFFRSILRSAPSLGAEYRSAPTAPAVKKKNFGGYFSAAEGGRKNLGYFSAAEGAEKFLGVLFGCRWWPKNFVYSKIVKKGRSGAKFAPLRHFVEYTPLR